PKKQYQQLNETKKELTRRLDRQSKQILQAKKQQLQLYIHQLALLNPLEIMKRGYAIPYNMDGDIVSSTAYLYPGDDVTFKLKDEPMTFETALKKLEKDVQEIEKEEVPLEKAIELYQEGMQLSKSCDDKLKNAENKMVKVMNEEGKLEPFDDVQGD